jgi:glycosyltransferase involved in cell wall biosynthesis
VHRLGSARLPHLGPVSPRAWVELPRVLATVDPDVVHIHASVGSPLALIAALSGRGAHRPTVVTVHSMWAGLSRPYRMLFAALGVTRRPIVWTAVSSAAAQQVRAAVPGCGVDVLPNGIDPGRWSRPDVRRHRDDVHLVGVLRLTGRKRPLALLDVLRRTRAAVPDDIALRASIIGDGPMRRAVRRYLRRHAMDWVELLGAQPANRVREVLHDADVFIATARLESFGIAALEARCAAVPVVALADTGARDFIEHGREGLLAAADDGLVAAVTRLATSPQARAKIAAYSRAVPARAEWPRTLAVADRAYAAARAEHPGRALRPASVAAG